MNKLRVYNASFPVSYSECYKKILNWSDTNFFKVKVLRTRDQFFEVLFTEIRIIEDEFIDTDNIKHTIKKLVTNELNTIFINRDLNNFVTINEPRTLLPFKNILAKIFNYDFYLEAVKIHPIDFIQCYEKLYSKTIIVNKIEIKNAIYINNIIANHIIKGDTDLRSNIEKIVKTKHFEISKIEGYHSEDTRSKICVTADYSIHYEYQIDSLIFKLVYSNTF